jgi:uncharacterized protein YggU (UPF0235/DUF167 family)
MHERFLIRLKAHPGAREDRLEQKGSDRFEVWVQADAEQGRANAAVLALLAGRLKTDPKRLRIVKGAASPYKIVTVLGMD